MPVLPPRTIFFGNPATSGHEPIKSQIVAYLEQIEGLTGSGAIKGFSPDVASLPASGNTTGDYRLVLDSDPEVMGVYQWGGSSWALVAPLPTPYWNDAYALLSQAWAEGEGEPGGVGTKSAKGWAAEAEADRVQTGLDRIATAADRVQTGLDRTSTTAQAAIAATQAGIVSAAAVAAAANAPIVASLTSPTPANGTVESLVTDAGVQVWRVVSGSWAFVGWITTPRFGSVATLLGSTMAIGPNGTIVEAGGFRYQVVSTGEHLTTAGAVKLKVLPGEKGYSALAFGIDNTGATDETAKMAILADLGEIYVPAGTYLCDTFEVPSNTIVHTDGFATRFKQTVSPGTDVRLITVIGSNVTIGPAISVEGQIDTHTGEQHHGVYIRATSVTGALSNIHVGDVYGENIRGDIVYVGAWLGYPLDMVTVGNVTGTNVLRNGVSHTGGNLKCGDVYLDRVGYMTVDVEPEPTYEPCYQSHFGRVKGGVVGSVAASSSSPNHDVQFTALDLDPDYVTHPSASYAPGLALQDGLLLRNTKCIKIGYMRSTNHDRGEVFVTFNSGELGCENFICDHMSLVGVVGKNDDATYPAMVHSQNIARIDIGTLEVSFSGDRVFNYAPHLTIGSVRASLGSDSRLVRNAGYVDIANIEVTGTGIVFQAITGGSVRNGTIVCNRLANACGKMTFDGITATAAVFLFDSSNDNHVIINSTMNGDFYSIGQFISDHTVPFRIGAYRLWVDNTGDLRIKSSAPTSDTDGTVVGTQT